MIVIFTRINTFRKQTKYGYTFYFLSSQNHFHKYMGIYHYKVGLCQYFL